MHQANGNAVRSCGRKKRHATMRNAEIALAATGAAFGDLTLIAYHCGHCGGFHIGHPGRAEQKELHYRRILNLIDRANRPAATVELTPEVGGAWLAPIVVRPATADGIWKASGRAGGAGTLPRCLCTSTDPDEIRAELKRRGFVRTVTGLDFKRRSGSETWARPSRTGPCAG